MHGKTIGLHRLRGRPVAVLFVAEWSQPSLEEMERLAALQRTDGLRAVMIGTGLTGTQTKALADRRQLDLLIVGDATFKLTRVWGVTCWPTAILLDRRGLVASVRFGKQHAAARPN